MRNGIAGGLIGTFGDLVGYMMNGKYYIRKRPGPRKTKPTPAQIAQQAKFRLVSTFLKSLKPLFQGMSPRHSWPTALLNKAHSYTYRHAVTGTYPDYRIQYANVVLTFGPLSNAQELSCASPAPGRLVFCWKDNSRTKFAGTRDRAFIMVYCESLQQWAFSLGLTKRSDGYCELKVPAFRGRTVHAWISFASTDGYIPLNDPVSNSAYAGERKVR
jgi:hypothetical protein